MCMSHTRASTYVLSIGTRLQIYTDNTDKRKNMLRMMNWRLRRLIYSKRSGRGPSRAY